MTIKGVPVDPSPAGYSEGLEQLFGSWLQRFFSQNKLKFTSELIVDLLDGITPERLVGYRSINSVELGVLQEAVGCLFRQTSKYLRPETVRQIHHHLNQLDCILLIPNGSIPAEKDAVYG